MVWGCLHSHLGVGWFEVLRQERDQIKQLEYMSTPSWFQVFQSASDLLYSSYQKTEVEHVILADTPHFVWQENDAIVPHTSLANLKQWSLMMGEVETNHSLAKKGVYFPVTFEHFFVPEKIAELRLTCQSVLVAQYQWLDPAIAPLRHLLSTPDENLDEVEWATKILASRPLFWWDNLVWIKWKQDPSRATPYGQEVMLIPMKCRLCLIQHFHDTSLVGHPGQKRLLKWLAMRFSWKGMKEDVIHFVWPCAICQHNKPSKRKPLGLHATNTKTLPSRPFEVMVMDAMGPYTCSGSSNCFILVFVCLFSGWVAVSRMKQASRNCCECPHYRRSVMFWCPLGDDLW